MRKILTIFILIGILTCNSTYLTAKNKKVLVVYFSRDGHTHMVAQKLVKAFGADSERLIDKKNRKGMMGTIWAGKDALAHKTTEIEPLVNNPNYYSIILIGTPGWFSNMAPAVRTFIKQYNLENKTIGLFATCHSIGANKATLQMAELISIKKAHTYPRLTLTHKDLKKRILIKKIEQFKTAIEAYQ